MKTVSAPLIGTFIGVLLLNTFASAQDSSENDRQAIFTKQTPNLHHLISASDPRFQYEGRFDFSNPNTPVIIWQASRISLDFNGKEIGLCFDNAKGQDYFNAEVDGSNTIVEASEGKPVRPAILSGLMPGRHHLELFKRSEATAGTVCFSGVELIGGAKIWAPQPPAYKLKMEFIGDSITAGACNEDSAADQWDIRRTHDAAFSYAAITAAAFHADHRNISVSGMGIATGYVPMKAGEIWDRLYPTTNSPRVNLAQWVPQVVFVYLGENDSSFSKANGQSFPTNFTDGYVSLVRAIRAGYPGTRIVLLRGGMYSGAQSEPLREAWGSAVRQLESTDKGICHFVFEHWTKTHPRVADDRIMANELIAWLNQQKFIQRPREATKKGFPP